MLLEYGRNLRRRRTGNAGPAKYALRPIGLGALNDRIGYRGAAGFDQAARDAGIIAYPRAEMLLSRTVGIDITGRIRDISQRLDQLPRA